MFQQVFTKTVSVALLLGIVASVGMHNKELKDLDWSAFYSYRKAVLADDFDGAMNSLRMTIGKQPTHITYINIKTKSGMVKTDLDPRIVKDFYIFKNANKYAVSLGRDILVASGFFTSLIFCLIFLLWSKFGKGLKDEKTKDGTNKILTAKEVKKILHKIGKASDLTIGDMPLVKDMETRHFLVTGSTGSGKTNLMHNILPQIKKREEPAIIIDNTGEMIAKYYDEARGDIIFNPFDARGKAWDFWADCSNPEELERFSKILFSFNRKRSGTNSDPFWEQSAEAVFNSCVEYLINNNTTSMSALKRMTIDATLETLQYKLQGTPAERYLSDDGKGLASSVLSMLATTTKPISYLNDNSNAGKFSLKEHFQNIKSGGGAWLFLATKPSSRQLTGSIIACLTELALCQLLDIGIKEDRRLWFVIDELSSLGKLPALPTLMSEGRKYGSSIICGLQSLNQLYSLYGQYEGSSIFGQFGTSFFFRNTENIIAKQVSAMSGMETITRQQKNTSFGANEFRDGISYSEQQQKKLLIEPSDLSSLATGECYVFLPEPQVRMAKIQIPHTTGSNKNDSFVAKNDFSYSEGNTHNSTPKNTKADATEEKPTSEPKVTIENKPKKQRNRKKSQEKTKSKTRSVETVL
jgi:type IV conjugative transfer system coupling protein TraD